MDGFGSNQKSEWALLSTSKSQTDPNSSPKPRILVAEDSKADVFLIREALDAAKIDAIVYVATDGEEAIEFLDWIEATPGVPCPDLILFDINLPKRMGDEVIRAFKNNNRCAATPVLIVTSSNSPEVRSAMQASGAAGHFHKPSDYREYMKLGLIVRSLLRGEES